MADEDQQKRKSGCGRWLLILAICFLGMKACSAFTNRPVALYKRWIGTSVPSDVSSVTGDYEFWLTESIAWLAFETNQERVDKIVARLGMETVVAPLAPGEEADEASRFSGNEAVWFLQIVTFDPMPANLQIYRKPFRDGGDYSSPSWVLYYRPSSKKVYWTSLNY